MSSLVKLFFWICFIYAFESKAQSYDLCLVLDTLDITNRSVCYKIGIKNTGNQLFNIAGQNYRIFYDSEKIEFNQNKSFSYLPLGKYTPFEVVNAVKNINASGTGDLSFEDNLGFINFYIDLNDTQNGGSFIEVDSTLFSSRICFDILDNNADTVCLDILFANILETAVYANAFNEISYWLGPNNTAAATSGEIKSINSDSLKQCLDFIENSVPVCNDGLDNDGDGSIDCDDTSCAKPMLTSIVKSEPTQSSCPEGDNGSLTITAENTTRYSKDGGLSWQSTGIFHNLKGGTYTITLINDLTGCTKDTTLILMKVACDEICNDGLDNDGDGSIDCDDLGCECLETDDQVLYPNIFSPINKDGVNDNFFIVVNENVYENLADIEVYNRWGNLIYNAVNKDITNLWDGNSSQNTNLGLVGVYIVKIKLQKKATKDILIKILSITII